MHISLWLTKQYVRLGLDKMAADETIFHPTLCFMASLMVSSGKEEIDFLALVEYEVSNLNSTFVSQSKNEWLLEKKAKRNVEISNCRHSQNFLRSGMGEIGKSRDLKSENIVSVFES